MSIPSTCRRRRSHGPATLQVIVYDAETVEEVGRWETALPSLR